MLVEFLADWCAPCRRLTPILDALAREFAGRVDFLKIDAEEALEVSARYAIESVPTVVVLRHGREAGRKVGLASAEDLRGLLARVLAGGV